MDTAIKAQLQQLDNVFSAAKPVIQKAGEIIDFIGPYAVIAYTRGVQLWGEAIHYTSEIKMFLGFFLLFFGSNFVFTLVAVQAFMVIGFERTKKKCNCTI